MFMLRSNIGALAAQQSLFRAAQFFKDLVSEALVFEALKDACPAQCGRADRTRQIVST
jgi:hypothetical protein